MDVVDIGVHCVTAVMIGLSLCIRDAEKIELEAGFLPCFVSERTAKVIAKYILGEACNDCKVLDAGDEYYVVVDGSVDGDVLAVRKWGGSLRWVKGFERRDCLGKSPQ